MKLASQFRSLIAEPTNLRAAVLFPPFVAVAGGLPHHDNYQSRTTIPQAPSLYLLAAGGEDSIPGYKVGLGRGSLCSPRWNSA